MAEENYIIFDIDRKRALDKLAIFDAKAALIDEKSLNRLNREFEGRSKVKEKFLFGWRNKNIKDSTLGMFENIIQQEQKEYEPRRYKQPKYNAKYL